MLVVDADGRGVAILQQAGDFFAGGEDFGCAVHDLQTFLIDADAIEQHVPVVGEFLLDGQGQFDTVADADRAGVAQRLVNQDGARAGKLGGEDGGHQGTAPHAVRNGLTEHAAFRVFGVDGGRVDVARQDGKQLDVFRHQRAGQAGTIADSDFVEGFIAQVAAFAGLAAW